MDKYSKESTLSMSKLFDIQDTTVAIADLTLLNTRGDVQHAGTISVAGNVNVNQNLSVAGTIEADTINVKNLVTDNGNLANVGDWIYNTEGELNGKGFSWTHGVGQTQLAYRLGNRLWTNANLDISANSTYSIDNIPVISATTLGGGVTNSRLTSVGTLSKLNVSGDVSIGEFAFFNTNFNKLGIGTEDPSCAITIIENNVELGIGSPSIGVGSFGTISCHDLTITTDNIPRITVKNNGEVNVGDPVHGGGVLNVYGVINAGSVVTDNRIDRTHPLQFSGTRDTSAFGLGLAWTDPTFSAQLVMMSGPTRLWSSENIDLGSGKSYFINNALALSENTLGASVTHSSLTSVGVLENLTVSGNTITNSLDAERGSFTANVQVGSTRLMPNGMFNSAEITVGIGETPVLFGDSTQITIGTKLVQSKPVKVFGPLSVNINNPDPSLQFSVNGDVSIGGKRFTSGHSAPTEAHHYFNKGDICWNTNPGTDSYVGWVCVTEGTPGQWAGFGRIGSQ